MGHLTKRARLHLALKHIPRRPSTARLPPSPCRSLILSAKSAEGVGFEPTSRVSPTNGFQDRPFQPLTHPSKSILGKVLVPVPQPHQELGAHPSDPPKYSRISGNIQADVGQASTFVIWPAVCRRDRCGSPLADISSDEMDK